MDVNGSGSTSDVDKKDIDQEKKPEKKYVRASECCIYRVPKKLRKINKDAYTSQFISIGPFHHGEKDLADMQEQKLRYRDEFVQKVGDTKFGELKIYVEEHEQGIRNCYAEKCKLPPEKFTEMILNDAVFIIELFWKNYHSYEGDFLLDQMWLKNAIKLDLQLLENQLPYFVLNELYRLAFGSVTEEMSLLSLSCKFLGIDISAVKRNEGKSKHFLDLKRYSMVEVLPDPKKSEETIEEGKNEEENIQDLPFAMMLNESGVTFKSAPNSKFGDRLLDIKFEKGEGCIPFFKGKELKIPRIVIEDCTECLMRNLMALEQCHYPSETHICNYVDLIDSLINTRKDVDLLFEKGIISNRVGDHATISEMFNKLCLEITPSESCYRDIIKDLKKYHEKWWNRTKATLMSVYFRDIWRGTATTAATIILLLTVLQTMQRFWRGWIPPPN